jgi:outer membrane protein TolC
MKKEKVKRELGSSSSTDFMNARVSFNNDSSSYLKQELQLLVAKKNLNLLLARDPKSEFDIQGKIIIQMSAMTFEQIEDLVVEKNKSVQISKQNKIVAEKNLSLSKSVYYPKLSLSANYGYTNVYTDRLGDFSGGNITSSDIESRNIDKSVGLNLSFNLFNGFRDKSNYQNAWLEARNNELLYNKSLIEIRGLAHEKYVSMHKQFDITNLEEENVIAAQQNLNIIQDLFQVGTATSLEFRDAQVNLARSQANLITAQFQAKMLQLELEQLAGILSFE